MSLFSAKSDTSVDVLSRILADSYVLLMKTQNVHWNVEGAGFRAIHLMSEEHYNDLFNAVDVVAERIRMLGGKSPATFDEFLKLASFDDRIGATDQNGMLKDLLKAHELVRKDLIDGIKKLSEGEDFGTTDVLGSRLAFHEKVIWMLKATLEEK